MFENPRRGRQARNFTTNAPKILDFKLSSEQIFSRKLPLAAPESFRAFSSCERKRFVEMKSFNSSKSQRLLDFVPSIRPSFLSVILVFVCGCLWVKNETTKERLIALESRINCFPCSETENLDRMTLSPTKGAARDLYKKIQITFSEGISYTPGKIGC